MSLFHKKCEECGTNINKLQSLRNIFLLKMGKKITCENCKSEYKVNNIISFIGIDYSWILLSYISISILLPGQKLGILFLIGICIVLEFLIIMLLPLKKANNDEFIYKFVHYILIAILTIILLYISFLTIFLIYSEFFSPPDNDWNAGDAIGLFIYVGGTMIIIFPLIILVSNKIIKYVIKGIKNGK